MASKLFVYWKWLAKMGLSLCRCFRRQVQTQKPKPRVYLEFLIRDRLKSVVGGRAEVSCPCGRIDLLTQTCIIEVKKLSQWKWALGQILSYHSFYPEHTPVLYLFGTPREWAKYEPCVMTICPVYGVTALFVDKSAGTDLSIAIPSLNV